MQKIKSIYTRYIHNVIIAAEAIMTNKVKSLLTALGIMFGVSAVISMLAIGKGAQKEVLEQIKMIGVNNIIVTPFDDSEANKNANNDGIKKVRLSKGLTLLDVQAIQEVIPNINAISPFISHNANCLYNGKTRDSDLIGIHPDYFKAINISINKGRSFTSSQLNNGDAVCVIGSDIYNHFFNNANAIGRHIKCDGVWLKIIGIIGNRSTSSGISASDVGSTNGKVFIPAKTMLLRFKDKGKINAEHMDGMARGGSGFYSSESTKTETSQTHQLDKIIVQLNNSEQLDKTAEIINRLILRRHGENKDFKVTIPELLLKQQQKNNYIFNLVLGAIAGISLIVGGIGIMNIMLASVWERIQEIGTRQAIGATRKDITVQFLSESVLISLSGGVIGILLGILMAYFIDVIADINTIISAISVIIAFFVSVSVGIIFGYLPAKKAAEQNPVESLRH